MIVSRESRILYTLDPFPQIFDEWRFSGFASVGVVGCFESVVDQHDRHHVLDAVVAVGEVVHGFELLVDDADAGFVCADCDFFDVLRGFTHGTEAGVDRFGGFDGGLGVEFGLTTITCEHTPIWDWRVEEQAVYLDTKL